MELTTRNVSAYFEKLSRRNRKDYIPLKPAKHLKTFRLPDNDSRYIVDRCYAIYQVGLRVKRFEIIPPNIILDSPSYSSVRLQTPFIAAVSNGELRTDKWAFDVGYCFREAIGLRYSQRKTTDKHTKKTRLYFEWLQSPVLRFSQGDLITHKNKKIMIQVEDALPSGFVDTQLEHGTLRCAVYEYHPGLYNWKLSKRYSGNQFDFLMVLIFGIDQLTRMDELLSVS